jgi:hypothetical protein
MDHFFSHCLHLACGIRAANNKIIGETAYFLRIQQDYVSRLFIAGNVENLMGYFECFQFNFLPGYLALYNIIPQHGRRRLLPRLKFRKAPDLALIN